MSAKYNTYLMTDEADFAVVDEVNDHNSNASDTAGVGDEQALGEAGAVREDDQYAGGEENAINWSEMEVLDAADDQTEDGKYIGEEMIEKFGLPDSDDVSGQDKEGEIRLEMDIDTVLSKICADEHRAENAKTPTLDETAFADVLDADADVNAKAESDETVLLHPEREDDEHVHQPEPPSLTPNSDFLVADEIIEGNENAVEIEEWETLDEDDGEGENEKTSAETLDEDDGHGEGGNDKTSANEDGVAASADPVESEKVAVNQESAVNGGGQQANEVEDWIVVDDDAKEWKAEDDDPKPQRKRKSAHTDNSKVRASKDKNSKALSKDAGRSSKSAAAKRTHRVAHTKRKLAVKSHITASRHSSRRSRKHPVRGDNDNSTRVSSRGTALVSNSKSDQKSRDGKNRSDGAPPQGSSTKHVSSSREGAGVVTATLIATTAAHRDSDNKKPAATAGSVAGPKLFEKDSTRPKSDNVKPTETHTSRSNAVAAKKSVSSALSRPSHGRKRQQDAEPKSGEVVGSATRRGNEPKKSRLNEKVSSVPEMPITAENLMPSFRAILPGKLAAIFLFRLLRLGGTTMVALSRQEAELARAP